MIIAHEPAVSIAAAPPASFEEIAEENITLRERLKDAEAVIGEIRAFADPEAYDALLRYEAKYDATCDEGVKVS